MLNITVYAVCWYCTKYMVSIFYNFYIYFQIGSKFYQHNYDHSCLITVSDYGETSKYFTEHVQYIPKNFLAVQIFSLASVHSSTILYISYQPYLDKSFSKHSQIHFKQSRTRRQSISQQISIVL